MSEKSDDKAISIPASTSGETALDVAAVISSAIPWIGGPVSNVLGGMSFGRKLTRIREVLEGLASDLKEFKSEISEKYVKTEDFEELLEQTLKRVAEERAKEKRKIYQAFLLGAIESPGEPYDEQIHFLRSLEELNPDHFTILRALSQEPSSNLGFMGSPINTLRQRLPELGEDRIIDLVAKLNDLKITSLGGLKTLMTAQGAEDLRQSVTPFGKRFLKYIMEN